MFTPPLFFCAEILHLCCSPSSDPVYNDATSPEACCPHVKAKKAPRRRPARVWKCSRRRPFAYQPGGGFAKILLASTSPSSSPALAGTPGQRPAPHAAEPGGPLASAGASLAPRPRPCRGNVSETFLGRSLGCCTEQKSTAKEGDGLEGGFGAAAAGTHCRWGFLPGMSRRAGWVPGGIAVPPAWRSSRRGAGST